MKKILQIVLLNLALLPIFAFGNEIESSYLYFTSEVDAIGGIGAGVGIRYSNYFHPNSEFHWGLDSSFQATAVLGFQGRAQLLLLLPSPGGSWKEYLTGNPYIGVGGCLSYVHDSYKRGTLAPFMTAGYQSKTFSGRDFFSELEIRDDPHAYFLPAAALRIGVGF